ncbi:MAG: hypothetical protein ACRDZO_04715 [Egibacteraceae bacterium]
MYPIGPPCPFDATLAAILRYLASGGYERAFGSRLPAAFEEQGLVDVGSEGRTVLVRGASPNATFYRLSLEQLRAPVVASGMIADVQVEAALEQLADPAFTTMMPCLVSTWGRMPG